MIDSTLRLQPESWRVQDAPEAVRLNGERAWADFIRRGLPGPGEEAWHYTDLKKFFPVEPKPVSSGMVETNFRQATHGLGAVIQMVDGKWRNELSHLPEGIRVLSLEEALRKGFGEMSPADLVQVMRENADRADEDHGGLVEMQQALLSAGVVIHVSAALKQPLQIRMNWSPNAEPRLGAVTNLIWLDENSSLTVIEENWGENELATSLWTQAHLKAGSKLEFIRLQHNEDQALSLGLLSVRQDSSSEFSGVALMNGGKLLRETWSFDHDGPGAATRLNALQLGSGRTQLDFHTVVNHQMERGFSQQRVRALAADRCRAIFNGKIVISKDAQNIDSGQLTQGLLLSEAAEINIKPQLEIYADNVKANHGASVGQLNEEELFYLLSRGIRRPDAMRMLSEGFARDAVSKIAMPELRIQLENWLSSEMKDLIQEGAL